MSLLASHTQFLTSQQKNETAVQSTPSPKKSKDSLPSKVESYMYRPQSSRSSFRHSDRAKKEHLLPDAGRRPHAACGMTSYKLKCSCLCSKRSGQRQPASSSRPLTRPNAPIQAKQAGLVGSMAATHTVVIGMYVCDRPAIRGCKSGC